MRTSAEKVKQIIDTDTEDTVVDAFISAANELVSEELGDTSLSDALLGEIETWVTAHFLSSSNLERQIKSADAGPTSVTYTGQYGTNFSLTSYGQVAMTLDTTGRLAYLGGKKASIRSVDTPDWSNTPRRA